MKLITGLVLTAAMSLFAMSCNDKTEYVRILDNDGEHLMPLSLFDGNAAQLADSLGLNDGIPSSISAYVVKSGGALILFDTGMGSPESCLIRNLEANGIKPEDIGYIYITHFHGDHIGGLMKGGKALFPNAEVYASQTEYDAWMAMPQEQNIQVRECVEAYGDRFHLFAFGDTLPGNVIAMDGGGHTPGHTVFRAGNLLIIGDLIHGAALQMTDPQICASFDMDKPKAILSRKHYLEYARENGLQILGMHLPSSY